MMIPSRLKAGPRLPKLVWALSSVGIAVGTLVLIVEYRAISMIRSQRVESEVLADDAKASLQSLQDIRTSAWSSIRNCLESVGCETIPDYQQQHLTTALNQCDQSFTRLNIDSGLLSHTTAQLNVILGKLCSVQDTAVRMSKAYQAAKLSSESAWASFQEQHKRARVLGEQIEGRKRLEQMLVLRTYRDAPETRKAELAKEFMNYTDSIEQTRVFRMELFEIALLGEKISKAESSDQLNNLRDNQLRPAIARLRRAEATSENPNKDFKQALDSLESALLGSQNRSQFVASDQSYKGLIAIRAEELLIVEQMKSLRQDVSDDVVACLAQEQKLSDFLQKSAEEQSAQAEAIVTSNWNHILGVSVVAFIGFISLSLYIAGLGRRVETRLKRSINEEPTRRKHLESEIEERKRVELVSRKLSAALEQCPVTVVITDTDGNIEYVNPGFTKTTGYTLDEVVGQNLLSLKAADQSMEAVETLWETILRGDTWRGEFKSRAKDGIEFWEMASISPIRYHDGSIRHFVAVKEDITQRKIHEDQLRNAKDQAECANRSKSEFLANMSHEIRTPITAILGFAEIQLEDDVAEEERTQATHTILRNGQHLLRIINDILDLSKMEVGKLQVEQVPCSLEKILADVKDQMQLRADAKGISISSEFTSRTPRTIESDPTRLRQILINLVSNGIKFTNQGGVSVVADLVQYSGAPAVEIKVSDDGIGMTEEQIARVFMPFEQADTSTTRKYGGTGLGLAISRRLVTLLGGELEVESEPQKGTVFTLLVPIGSITEVAEGHDQPQVAAKLESSADPLACHILVAEDGPDNQRLIRRILEKAGATVTVVQNGQLALEAALRAQADGCHFEIILMDMQMPVMDGYAATAALRESGYSAPIIALTAHAMAGDRQKCIEAGCNDYTTKPINRKALIQMIRSFLGQPESVS